jgi:hypothetical protein
MKRKWTSAILTTLYLQINNGSGFMVSWKEIVAVVNRVHGTDFTPAAARQAWTRHIDRHKYVLAKLSKQDDALLTKLAEIEARAGVTK